MAEISGEWFCGPKLFLGAKEIHNGSTVRENTPEKIVSKTEKKCSKTGKIFPAFPFFRVFRFFFRFSNKKIHLKWYFPDS